MGWKESLKTFFASHLDISRYVTGVLTGMTISLLVAIVSGFLWIANRLIQWVASLIALLADRPIVSQESLWAFLLSATIFVLSFSLFRLFFLLGRMGERVKSEEDRKSTEVARTLEALNELARSYMKQVTEEAQRLLNEQGPPNFAGTTGVTVPTTGIYQSLEPPYGAIHLEKGAVFPQTTEGDDGIPTAWIFKGHEAT